MTTAETIAKAFHEAYERLAPDHGYETREASAKPWQDVPAGNKGLMIATVQSLIDEGLIAAPPRRQWYAMHDHGAVRHQHFPADAGHGSHGGVPLEPLRQVEGSTPIASPAPAPVLTEAAYWTDDADGDPIIAAPAGAVVSVPPPGEADVYLCSTCMAVITFTTGEAPRCPNCPPPAAEPAPVPPPVDALLKLIDRAAHCNTCDNPSINPFDEEEIESMVRALFAAGVAEGRRQAAAAIRAADTSGWPGGRGGDVDECQELAAKIAEVLRG